MRKKKPVALFTADIHWMTRTPEYRKEKIHFEAVIAAKIDQCAKLCAKHGVLWFNAGDVFDRSRDFMDMWTAKTAFVESLFKRGVTMYSVRGQHDKFHHNEDEQATSFNVLLESETGLCEFNGMFVVGTGINIYGAGWGDEIPKPAQVGEGIHNVLMLHKTLWHKTPIFPGQVTGNVGVESVRLHELGYDMVFSGDNHKAFDVKVGGVEFHNIGAFTRKDTTLVEQQPRCMILYDDMTVESVELGEHNVFETERSEGDKSRESLKDEFSEALAGGFDHNATFKGNLETVVASGVCGEAVLTETQRDRLRNIIGTI